eukprot:18067-Amphidinium_carterae.1
MDISDSGGAQSTGSLSLLRMWGLSEDAPTVEGQPRSGQTRQDRGLHAPRRSATDGVLELAPTMVLQEELKDCELTPHCSMAASLRRAKEPRSKHSKRPPWDTPGWIRALADAAPDRLQQPEFSLLRFELLALDRQLPYRSMCARPGALP